MRVRLRIWENAVDIKIVIADEHRIGREGLKSLFQAEPEMSVVGEAEDGQAVVQLISSLSPDVVLMGLDMPGLSGVDATRQMLQLKPSVRVIGLAAVVDAQMVRDILAAGGVGFITKCNSFADFVAAVRSVMAQRIYLSSDVALAMVNQYVLRPPPDVARPSGTLTPREREVLQLVAGGMSTKQTAIALKISTKTVDMHRQHIMGKLNIHSVAELTKYAIREGLTELRPNNEVLRLQGVAAGEMR